MEDQMTQNCASRLPTEIILVVDDSKINRMVLSHIFSATYRIEEAADGAQALARLRERKEPLSAVLLDVVMPVMDGLEVLEYADRMGLTQEIPFFLITADTTGETLRRAYDHGVMDVINKPVVPYVAERRIQSVIELFQGRRRLRCTVEAQRTEISHQADQIIQLNLGMIEALSTAIEFRSGESGAHVRRIHDITKYMLLHTPMGAGLPVEEIDQIALAAITHDVGKIAIPDHILNKPGRLTPEEYDVMKGHTLQGGLLLEKIPQMRDHAAFRYAHDIALHHHERWDGNGYPHGLKGDAISIWSQIVSLADVYDALVSERVYKKAFPAQQAMEMIAAGACGVFQPRLLAYFQAAEPEIRRFYTEGATQ